MAKKIYVGIKMRAYEYCAATEDVFASEKKEEVIAWLGEWYENEIIEIDPENLKSCVHYQVPCHQLQK